MTKLLATIKAIITRVVFACHGLVAIWQVIVFKKNKNFWYLASPTILLILEGVFTLTIKDNQEWKWFCPSVFIYLGNVVPAIWLLELYKVEKRLQARESHMNLTLATGVDLKDFGKILGTKIHIPDIPFSTETWVTLIEQFLMLTLIVGRWLLPKGDLTRDQLSQLLLVYIGTAADIIEFFDSFKDEKIISDPLLVLLSLSIWSWSLLQFTVVLTATKSRKSRISTNGSLVKTTYPDTCWCSIDVCAIVMNIALQDAPFLAFRLLIICHYRIVSYMNVFFTCKNTLVILLQMYRLYVVHSETNKAKKKDMETKANSSKAIRIKKDNKRYKNKKNHSNVVDLETENIAIITDSKSIQRIERSKLRAFILTHKDELRQLEIPRCYLDKQLFRNSSDNDEIDEKKKNKIRKDTGYSTASSQTSNYKEGAYRKGANRMPTTKSRSMQTGAEKNHDRAKRSRRRKDDYALSEEGSSSDGNIVARSEPSDSDGARGSN